MDAAQLKAAGEQLLLHYRRSGITFLPTSQSSIERNAEEWLDTHVPDWRSVSTSPSSQKQVTAIATATAEANLNNGRVNLANLSGESKASPLPLISPKSPAHLLGEPSSWPEPSLSVEDRKLRLEQLNQQVMACRKCEDIVCRRNRTVFGVGPVDAKIVMFGEAPGADEDRVGEPFVGAAGQLLDRILVASGLKRENVYILNALKCRPPNNRTPVDAEIENCRPFFEEQLETIQPQYIVCWGAVAVRSVLKSTESVGRLRGRFHSYRGAKVMVTYHPAYLLRNADAKKLTWEDMKMLMRELGIPIAPPSSK